MSAPAVAEFQRKHPEIVVVSVATDGSPDEFAEFIADYELEGLHQLYDTERPALVASMLEEHRIHGVPGFLAVRPDGSFATTAGWNPLTERRLANFLAADE